MLYNVYAFHFGLQPTQKLFPSVVKEPWKYLEHISFVNVGVKYYFNQLDRISSQCTIWIPTIFWMIIPDFTKQQSFHFLQHMHE